MTRPGPVATRSATEADLPLLVAWEEEAFGVDRWSPALVAEGVAGLLPTVAWLVAERDGVPLGYAVVSVAGDLAELQRIAVAPGHRRTGVARSLIAAVVASAVAAGAASVLLEVWPGNEAAVAAYEHAGFTTIDRRRRYYRDGADALVMRRECGADDVLPC